ncbi:DUF6384 family protein [Rhodopirellula sp. MGV]|uniref:DUF6384 family protein n=1 Tax=Rhodopirellula sp. MGV TaxID=2023130 RepID=UPI000B979299|nr:DUF6384 family protein [Rhodopirellula sp. MGV]OYP31696.1 hypothetical protein CGZ80_20590 [Rhodopirellula sp. MGV]PNY33997.1 hypothetical protein C2E31_25535 [Rhodopirellula baltica]
MSQAQATQSIDELPEHELTIAETLRVMDVAREMRDQREQAEVMFRRDEMRDALRAKLLRTAALSGDSVTEAEIDAAIDQYLETQHTYSDPPSGLQSVFAYGWVWRKRIAAILAFAAAAGFFYLIA